MDNLLNGKIGFSSRYYEPFRTLRGIINSQNVFKLVYNSDKETYHLPYLYQNYTNQLEPIFISNKIVSSVKKYLSDNLFSIEEIKLLLSELMPYLAAFGDDTIKYLSKWANVSEKSDVPETIKADLLQKADECRKTIDALRKIKEIINAEITSYYISLTNSTQNQEELLKAEPIDPVLKSLDPSRLLETPQSITHIDYSTHIHAPVINSNVASNSNNSHNQQIMQESNKKMSKSIIEISSWIAGIIAAIIAVYEFLIKK